MKLINVKWTDNKTYSEVFINADLISVITHKEVFLKDKDKTSISFGEDFRIAEIIDENGKTISKLKGIEFSDNWVGWDKSELPTEKEFEKIVKEGKKLKKEKSKEQQIKERVNQQIKMNEEFGKENKDDFVELQDKVIKIYRDNNLKNSNYQSIQTILRMLSNHIEYLETGKTKWDKKYLNELDSEK